MTSVDRPAFARFLFTLICLPILLCGLSGISYAQSESGSAAIEGTVTDPNGQAISGAIITIQNRETGYTRKLTTDGRGQFVASVMPIGQYSLEAAAGNFTTVKRENIVLMVGNTEKVNLSLKVAAVNEQVTVTSDQGAVDTEESATGRTIV